MRNLSGSGFSVSRAVSMTPLVRSRSSASPCFLGTKATDAIRGSVSSARRIEATCAGVASVERYAEISIWSSSCVPSPARAPRTKRKSPSKTSVMATVPIAVSCMPALREKLRNTSPRKNLTLPQSKIVIAPFFVGDDSSVFEPHDSASHPIDDGLVVRRDDDRRPFEIDAEQQLHDFGRVGRIQVPGRLVAQ